MQSKHTMLPEMRLPRSLQSGQPDYRKLILSFNKRSRIPIHIHYTKENYFELRDMRLSHRQSGSKFKRSNIVNTLSSSLSIWTNGGPVYDHLSNRDGDYDPQLRFSAAMLSWNGFSKNFPDHPGFLRSPLTQASENGTQREAKVADRYCNKVKRPFLGRRWKAFRLLGQKNSFCSCATYNSKTIYSFPSRLA